MSLFLIFFLPFLSYVASRFIRNLRLILRSHTSDDSRFKPLNLHTLGLAPPTSSLTFWHPSRCSLENSLGFAFSGKVLSFCYLRLSFYRFFACRRLRLLPREFSSELRLIRLLDSFSIRLFRLSPSRPLSLRIYSIPHLHLTVRYPACHSVYSGLAELPTPVACCL